MWAKVKAWIVTKWWQYWAWDKKIGKRMDDWSDKMDKKWNK